MDSLSVIGYYKGSDRMNVYTGILIVATAIVATLMVRDIAKDVRGE
jgi:hypothetical protein